MHKIIISDSLQNAIWQTWNAIAPDVSQIDTSEGLIGSEEALELCVDANRLETFVGKEAEAEFQALIAQHDLDLVYAAMNEQIHLL